MDGSSATGWARFRNIPLAISIPLSSDHGRGRWWAS